ncbi:MAG: SurA N-terminal domain-containing protein [Desulfobacterales bacterium]|nr:SurA N-terminal domain-containing protein [Desulfobacterales bacterium]
MLKFMRTHATSWFIKILLTLIIVVFVLWGMGSIKGKKETIIATVGGDHITRVEFDRAYRNFRKNLEGQLSPELLKGLNIKQQVLDQLIDATVEQQEAQNIGLRVSDEELMQIISQNPAFQRDGQFDGNLYEQFLRNIGLDTVTFPALLKRELMNQRVGNLVGNAAAILTEEEVKELYVLENAKINLSFVEVSPQAFAKQVTVTEGDLERYYAEHKEEFRAPARVKVLYLRFSPGAYLKEVEVSSQEVQDYYAMNREQYQRPERVWIRHILIRVSPDAGSETVEKARLKAQKVLTAARQGANFAALARQYSDDASASKGGDLGYFSRGEIEPTLGKVVFDLRKGEIGPVVRTSHGFHIVKKEDVQEGTRRTLDEARKEIVSRLMNEKAKDRAAMHAEDAAYQARNKTGGLKPYADGVGLKVREAGPFKAGEPEAKEKLPSVAFTLEKGDISSPFQDGEDYLILQVVDKIPPQAPPLERVRGRIKEAFASSVARGLAQGAARNLLTAWEKGPGFGDLLRRYGLKVAETGFFKRNSAAPPRLGLLGAYAGKIATLTLEDPWPDDIAEVNGAFVVVKLTGVERMDE